MELHKRYRKWSDKETYYFENGVFASVVETERKDKDGYMICKVIVEKINQKTGEIDLLDEFLVSETEVVQILEEIEYDFRDPYMFGEFEEMWDGDQYVRVYYDDYGFEVGTEILSERKLEQEEKSIFDAYFEMENA